MASLTSIRVALEVNTASNRLFWNDKKVQQLEFNVDGKRVKKCYLDFLREQVQEIAVKAANDEADNGATTILKAPAFVDQILNGFKLASYLENGENAGVIVGSLGNHQKDALKSKIFSIFERLDDSRSFTLGCFAFTDSSLVDLCSDRNLQLNGFKHEKHLKKADLQEIKAALDLSCSLPSVVIITITSGTTNSTFWMIDLKGFAFGMTEDDCLTKSMVKLDKNIQLLTIPGSEGALDYNSFPLGMFCAEMFGGNAHTLCSFYLDSSNPEVSDQAIGNFIDWASNVRKVRNLVKSAPSDGMTQRLEEATLQLATEQKNALEITSLLERVQSQYGESQHSVKQSQEEMEVLKSEILSMTMSLEEEVERSTRTKQEMQVKLDLQNIATLDYKGEIQTKAEEKAVEFEVQLADQVKQYELNQKISRLDVITANDKLAIGEEKIIELSTQNALLRFKNDDLEATLLLIKGLDAEKVNSIRDHSVQLTALKESHEAAKSILNEKNLKLDTSAEEMIKVKDECQLLLRQILELQSKAMDQTQAKEDSNFERKCEDLNREKAALAKNLQSQEKKVARLESLIEDGEGAKKDLAILQSQIKANQELLIQAQSRVKALSQESIELKVENSSIKTQLSSHQTHAAELKERLEQTISLLEAQAASGQSKDDEQHQVRLQEERTAQKELVDKMMDREAHWAQERKDLMETMMAAKAAEEVSSIKRSIVNLIPDDQQKSKSKKTKLAKKVVSALDCYDESESTEEFPEEPVEKAKAVKVTRAAKESAAGERRRKASKKDNVVASEDEEPIRKKIVSKRGVVMSDEDDETSSEPVPSLKQIVKKAVKQPKQSKASLPVNSLPSDENNDPKVSLKPVVKNVPSRPPPVAGIKTGAGCLVSGLWKRPRAEGQDQPSVSLNVEDILPNIPKKYVDQRRLQMLFGGNPTTATPNSQ